LVKFIKKSGKKRFLPPGSIVHVGDKKTEKIKISLMDYSIGKYDEKEIEKIKDCYIFKRKPSVTWINVDGLHDVDIINKIGECFVIHPLVLEDIVNTDQRPKMEVFDKFIFFVLKMVYYDNKSLEINSEQVSLILGSNYVISFQEKIGDVFDTVRERIRKVKGRIRKMGSDYLAYSLIDAIVDNYFNVLEKISDRIENIEEDVISNPKPDILQQIYNLKREMIYLRKSVWPLRELISGLIREESKLIKDDTHIYLRDLYDHTIQIIDTIETFRDMISGMLDIYMSSVSNKMNEVMKVLTIFAAIFIPLTFIAGVYGMNFHFMPELSLQWGYFGILTLMLFVGIIMLIFFKRKKWM
jgi:magnesium transporter